MHEKIAQANFFTLYRQTTQDINNYQQQLKNLNQKIFIINLTVALITLITVSGLIFLQTNIIWPYILLFSQALLTYQELAKLKEQSHMLKLYLKASKKLLINLEKDKERIQTNQLANQQHISYKNHYYRKKLAKMQETYLSDFNI